MMNRTLTGLGAAALTAGLLTVAGLRTQADEAGGWTAPPGGVADLIKDDTKVVTDTLKAAKVDKKDVKRAKVSTMLLGLYAEASKDKSAALHGQAAKVLEALLKEDGLGDAKKAAAGLASPSGDAAAKVDWVKALWDEDNKDYDRDLAMQLFKSTRAGGLGYEKKVKDFAEKAPGAKDMTDLGLLARKTVVIAQVLDRIAPTKAAGGQKTPENWKKYAKDLQASATEAATAAGKKDAAAVKAAMGKMDKSCVNCHEVFK